MRLQTLVAVTDFSAPAEHALDRAALLAAHHQARLAVVYAAERQDAKFCDPQARLAQRARQLARRHGLSVHPLGALQGAGLADALVAAATAAQADLLVMDARLHGPQRWPAGALGLRARVLRASPCPVLLVQQPAGQPYGHVLVHAQGDGCGALARCAGALQGGAVLELFHAARPQGLSGLGLACGQAFARALQRAGALPVAAQAGPGAVHVSDAFQARRNRVGLARRGLHAMHQLAVQQDRSGADLLVLAHPRRPVLRELLQASAAHRLLTGRPAVACDVLVVPQAGGRPAPQRTAGADGTVQSAVARRWTQAT